MDALRARRAPSLERTHPPVVVRGMPAPLAVAVRADGPVRVRQALPADVTLEPQESDGDLAGELVARRRGRHVLPPVGVRAAGPLGLGAWYHRVGGDAEVLVYPDLVGARRLALAARRGKLPDAGRRARGAYGLGTAFEAVRDYSPDDDVRQINWRATARLERPMSNQYRIDQDQEVRCLLDAGRLSAAACADGTLLDVALDGLVAVCATADALGDRSGAIAFADRVLRDVAPSRLGAAAVTRALFDVEPVDADSDYELAFRTIAGGKRGFVLVLADLVDEAAARALVSAVPVLARRHAVCVASVRDDALDEILRRRPAELRDAYAMSVALEMRRARALAARRVGRRRRHRRRGAARALRGARASRRMRARRRAAEREDESPVEDAERDPERQHDGGREAAGDEALDEAGEHEPGHRPEHDADRARGLGAQGLGARSRRRARRSTSRCAARPPRRRRCTRARARRGRRSAAAGRRRCRRSLASPTTAPSRIPFVAST